MLLGVVESDDGYDRGMVERDHNATTGAGQQMSIWQAQTL